MNSYGNCIAISDLLLYSFCCAAPCVPEAGRCLVAKEYQQNKTEQASFCMPHAATAEHLSGAYAVPGRDPAVDGRPAAAAFWNAGMRSDIAECCFKHCPLLKMDCSLHV